MTHQREITVEDAKARFLEMCETLGDSIAEAAQEFAQRGTSASWVAVAFDGSDEHAMRLYKKLGPTWEAVPEDGAILVACALPRLDRAAYAVGYKRSRGQWGDHVPGSVRVVAYTLGIVIVQHVRTVDVIEPGRA